MGYKSSTETGVCSLVSHSQCQQYCIVKCPIVLQWSAHTTQRCRTHNKKAAHGTTCEIPGDGRPRNWPDPAPLQAYCLPMRLGDVGTTQLPPGAPLCNAPPCFPSTSRRQLRLQVTLLTLSIGSPTRSTLHLHLPETAQVAALCKTVTPIIAVDPGRSGRKSTTALLSS